MIIHDMTTKQMITPKTFDEVPAKYRTTVAMLDAMDLGLKKTVEIPGKGRKMYLVGITVATYEISKGGIEEVEEQPRASGADYLKSLGINRD